MREQLKEINIKCKIINNKEKSGMYEHFFVLAYFKKEEVEYVLIDLTFEQFIEQ